MDDHLDDQLERVWEDGRSLRVYRDRPASLYRAFAGTARTYPEAVAIISDDEKITYDEWLSRVDRAAEHLAHTYALRRGDRIGLLFPNTIAFCELLLAAAKVGVVAVLLNAKLTARELSYMIGHSGCRMLFYDAAYEEKAGQLTERHPDLRRVRAGRENSSVRTRDAAYETVVSRRLPLTLTDSATENDPCYLMYTSGTTGIPKGALALHRNVIHSAMNYYRLCGTTSGDTTLIAIPLFHVTGLIGQFVHMLMIGGTSVLLREYSTDAYIRASLAHDVTFMFNVPTIYNMLLTREESARFTKLRLALYGGAPMTAETISRLRSRFPGLMLRNAYGATETSSPATIMPADWPADKIASVGKPVPGADIRIMDEHGNRCEPGEVGELWISGAMVIPSYWDNDSANASSFTDGFWKSGDAAKMDEDGYVYIMDRKKDLINRGGEKIYSVEIESVLANHPQIAEAAVVGVPDDIFGEQIKAYIVPKGDQSPDAEEVKAFVRTYLASYKVPKYVECIAAIPRNPGGKIMKQRLRGEQAKDAANMQQLPKQEGSDAR